MKDYTSFIESLVRKGGPDPEDYEELDQWIRRVANGLESGDIPEENLAVLKEAFGEALSTNTMQGLSLIKPRGYAGDFEIIDRVYQRSLVPNARLINWDQYFHIQEATRAVRNRKKYFIELIAALASDKTYSKEKPLQVLNIASGPARDVLECLNLYPDLPIHFDCIDYDQDAIAYARALCYQHTDRTHFKRANAFRYKSEKKYDLVWSAGLFDYLDNRRFTFLLTRLLEMVGDEGELVIGNFSENNPTRPMMQVLMDWHLIHRPEEEMGQLAESSGISKSDYYIGKEPRGVNLFLHIKKGKQFLQMS